uniref:Uncharacterized protein n=1 Tax=Aegilops tauschii subsp. strangulata TaxID=200361 RepID=A0A453MGX7_AEGTS
TALASILQPLTLYHCLQLSRIQTSRYDGHDTLHIHYLGKICYVQLSDM